jgi:1-acyl-sn-glycerol-3-phosphate acyltransferase
MLFIALDTAILGTLVILLSYFDPHGNVVYYIARFWCRLNMLLSGIAVSVEGKNFIKKTQPYIVMSNHQSHVDVWALSGYMPLQLRWVIKIELRKVPIFGLGCERMGNIYVDRGNSRDAQQRLKVAGEKIRAGASVIIFPEGTRSPDGKLLPFKKGGFVIALEAGVPILPVTVVGGKEILPKKSLKFLPGRMKLIIHEPIPVDGYTNETKEELIRLVKETIEQDLA